MWIERCEPLSLEGFELMIYIQEIWVLFRPTFLSVKILVFLSPVTWLKLTNID